MDTRCDLGTQIEQRLLARNAIFEKFFASEALRLAEACREMSERFLRGGRLLAFGRGPYATDAQHVSVEFVHPVIVGKRALPALDLSMLFRPWLEALLHPEDMVMGFGPPEGDPEIWSALQFAHERRAMTFALPGTQGSYSVSPDTPDPFVHQELIEILYHTLWETVHVFFDHHQMGHEVGDAGFLYPFLGKDKQATGDVITQVAESIRMKVRDDAQLRERVALEESEKIGDAATAMRERIRRGGKLIIFGNGGSATDANDWALDCIMPPAGYQPIPAVSLAMEPA
ncbi:MAG: SIS domain-containing protein, partial [Candidatus Acidiferrum sp.]